MTIRKHTRTLSAAVLFAGVPFAVSAQTTTNPPTDTRPNLTEPGKATDPAMKPADPSTTTTRPIERQTTAPSNKANPLIGLAVFSADGNKLGNVQSVSAESDGKVKAIHLKSGGFLGFGGKMVAIPEGKFTRSGDNIQLAMTADEVSKLPEFKQQS